MTKVLSTMVCPDWFKKEWEKADQALIDGMSEGLKKQAELYAERGLLNARIIKHEAWRKLENSDGFNSDDLMGYNTSKNIIEIIDRDERDKEEREERESEGSEEVLSLLKQVKRKGIEWPFPKA